MRIGVLLHGGEYDGLYETLYVGPAEQLEDFLLSLPNRLLFECSVEYFQFEIWEAGERRQLWQYKLAKRAAPGPDILNPQNWQQFHQ